MAVAVALLFLVLASPAVYAVDHVVGGNSGWSLSGTYDSWAAGDTFTVGDKLIFNYDSSHGVDEVGQSDYNNCATSNAINSYTGGKTTITLSKPGPMYFVCPSFGHCGQGMKLSITVQAAGGSPSGSPPSTPTTPSTPAGGSTTPSSGGSTTPSSGTPPSTSTPASRTSPSPPNGASGSFGSINHLMLGLSLVLATLITFRG